MHPLSSTVEKLNSISFRILEELEKEEPSLEAIQEELNNRAEFAHKLEELSSEHTDDALSQAEKVIMKSMVESFVQMNEKIQQNLKTMMEKHKENLHTAISQRKAVKGYKISKQPDISYF